MQKFTFNRPKITKAAVIFPDVYSQHNSIDSQYRLQEASGLAYAINLEVVYQDIIKIRQTKAATFIGQGIINQLKDIISNQEIDLIIFDTNLTPIQQRNLENQLSCKVIDRTALILEIFGERAQTKEGKLQVELAHLTYQRSRLVRSWTHLERQRGGGGFLGGPGETQIELDRRLIDEKIIRIKKSLEKVKNTRAVQRQSRQNDNCPIVALVGYTNAGKSTLFNLLSQSSVLAKDMLFATLDTTMRQIKLPSGNQIILSDTVGFISSLPHELIMAFRSTLEEAVHADIILHIRDISSQNSKSQRTDVIDTLENIGLNKINYSDKYIEVLNKSDLLSSEKKEKISRHLHKNQVLVSSLKSDGIDNLLSLIDAKLSKNHQTIQCQLDLSEGKTLSWIYDNMQVISIKQSEQNYNMTLKGTAENLAKLLQKGGIKKLIKVSKISN